LSLLTIFGQAFVISTSGVVTAAAEIQTGNTTNDSFNKFKQLLHSVIYTRSSLRMK
jgi:hypothetical protein